MTRMTSNRCLGSFDIVTSTLQLRESADHVRSKAGSRRPAMRSISHAVRVGHIRPRMLALYNLRFGDPGHPSSGDFHQFGTRRCLRKVLKSRHVPDPSLQLTATIYSRRGALCGYRRLRRWHDLIIAATTLPPGQQDVHTTANNRFTVSQVSNILSMTTVESIWRDEAPWFS
jgi:hypothetical protein